MAPGFAVGELPVKSSSLENPSKQITTREKNTDNDDDIKQRLTKLLLSDNSRTSFEKSYTLKMKLMSGFFGTVYTGIHNSTGEKYAVKVVERR